MKNLIAGMVAVSALGAGAMADIEITEAFVGLSGEDGTSDWFEITWTGAGTFDTGTLWYDDDSADFASADQLSSIILNTGESAVFIIDDASGFADFTAVWGGGILLGFADGSGLGQGGDGITLFDAGGTIIESVVTVGEHTGVGGVFATFQYDAAGNQTDSVLGVNGAYQSGVFMDEDEGARSLIGSPGRVPAPGSAALLALGGLVGARRRR
ncbi:MAG: hypothetical protein ACIARR_06525 [Phycisphaerales bacterium JB059]